MRKTKREKAEFDILGKISSEREKRGWTEYTLSRNAGITQSTISTWYKKQMQPSVSSIEKISRAFGMTLSEFFQEKDGDTGQDGEITGQITREQKKLLRAWDRLGPREKDSFMNLMETVGRYHNADDGADKI